MMNRVLLGISGLALALYVLILSSVFTVDEREWAVLFRFGEIIQADFEPGIHFKIPIYQTIKKYDKRIQTLDALAVRYQTVELKNVLVESFVKWRIKDVAKYFVSIGSGDVNARLAQNFNDLSRGEFGKRTVNQVVSGDRSEIMSVLKNRGNEFSHHFGIEIVDVRIKRVDLPAEVSSSVFQRMDAERTRVAKDLRSKGAAQAEEIRAEADKERTIILAEANRQSEVIRGGGDAKASATYAEAYNRDAAFYSFYRSLGAYRKMLNAGGDIMVIKPDNDFFRFFNQSGATEKP